MPCGCCTNSAAAIPGPTVAKPGFVAATTCPVAAATSPAVLTPGPVTVTHTQPRSSYIKPCSCYSRPPEFYSSVHFLTSWTSFRINQKFLHHRWTLLITCIFQGNWNPTLWHQVSPGGHHLARGRKSLLVLPPLELPTEAQRISKRFRAFPTNDVFQMELSPIYTLSKEVIRRGWGSRTTLNS